MDAIELVGRTFSSSDEGPPEDELSGEAAIEYLTLKANQPKTPRDFHAENLKAIHTKSSINQKAHDASGFERRPSSLSPPRTSEGNRRSTVRGGDNVEEVFTEEPPLGRHGSLRLHHSGNRRDVYSGSAPGSPLLLATPQSTKTISTSDPFSKSIGDSRNALLSSVTDQVKEAGKAIGSEGGMGSRAPSFVLAGSRSSRRSVDDESDDMGHLMQDVDEEEASSEGSAADGETARIPSYLRAYEKQQRLYRKEDLSGLSPGERVRRRLQLQRQLREAEGQAVLERTHQRAKLAELKRDFQESLRNQQVCGMWATVLVITLSAQRFRRLLSNAKALRVLRFNLLPKIYLKAHRLIRKGRLLSSTNLLERPSVDALKKDKIFSFFPEDQLQRIIRDLQPQFYMKGDVLMYQGSGGSDCFVINSGDVSVTVDGSRVATLGQGSVIGTPGMVSGEPRMATIRAITDVLVWVGSKSSFDSAVGDSQSMVRQNRTFEVIAEMHVRNIPTLYKKALRAEGLARFAAFALVDKDRLNEAGAKFEAMFIDEGHTVVAAKTRAFTGYYILHGSVSVEIPIPAGMSPERAFYTALRIVCDVYQTKKKRRRDLFDAIMSQLEQRRNKPSESFSVTLRGLGAPLLIGIPNLLFGDPYELSVIAEGRVDAMVVRREALVDSLLEDPFALNTARRLASLARLGHFPHWYLSSQFPRGDPITLAPNPVFITTPRNLGDSKSNATMLSSGSFDDPSATVEAISSKFSYSLPPNTNNSRSLSVSGSNPDDCFMISRGTLDVDHHSAIGTHPHMWPPLHEAYYGGFTGTANTTTREVTCVRVRRRDIHRAIESLHPDDKARLISVLESAILSGHRGLLSVPDPKEFWVAEAKAAKVAAVVPPAGRTATTPKSNAVPPSPAPSDANLQAPQQLKITAKVSPKKSKPQQQPITKQKELHSWTDGEVCFGASMVVSPTQSPDLPNNIAPHNPRVPLLNIPREGSIASPLGSFRREKQDAATPVAMEESSAEVAGLSRKNSLLITRTPGSGADLKTALGRKVSFQGRGNDKPSSSAAVVSGVDGGSNESSGLSIPHTHRIGLERTAIDDVMMLKMPPSEDHVQPTTAINKLEVHDHLGRRVASSDIDGSLSIPRFTPRRRGLTGKHGVISSAEESAERRHPITGKLIVHTDTELLELMRDHVPAASPYSVENMALAQMKAKRENRRPVYAPGYDQAERLPRRANILESVDEAVRRKRTVASSPKRAASPLTDRDRSFLELPDDPTMPSWLSPSNDNAIKTGRNVPLPSGVGLVGPTGAPIIPKRAMSPAGDLNRSATDSVSMLEMPLVERELPRERPPRARKEGAQVVVAPIGYHPTPPPASSTKSVTHGRRSQPTNALQPKGGAVIQTGLLSGSVLGEALSQDNRKEKSLVIATQFQSNRAAFLDLQKRTGKQLVTSAGHTFAQSSNTVPQSIQPQTARSLPYHMTKGGSPPSGAQTSRTPLAGRRAAPSWLPPATFVVSRM